MVLGKLPVPGFLTKLDESRTRAYCASIMCGWGLFGDFFSLLSFLFWGGRVVRRSWVNSVPGPHTYFDESRARAYCACNRCGWGCLAMFLLVYIFFSLSHSLGDGTI